jgi:hypothetical protein
MDRVGHGEETSFEGLEEFEGLARLDLHRSCLFVPRFVLASVRRSHSRSLALPRLTVGSRATSSTLFNLEPFAYAARRSLSGGQMSKAKKVVVASRKSERSDKKSSGSTKGKTKGRSSGASSRESGGESTSASKGKASSTKHASGKNARGRERSSAGKSVVRVANPTSQKLALPLDTLQERLAAVPHELVLSAPNKPVKVAILEGERLKSGIGKYKKALAGLPGFRLADVKLLPEAIEALESAERHWSRTKVKQGDASLVALRKEAEKWRAEAMAAARYLLRNDASAGLEIERIGEGDGLADLVQDLEDLAALVKTHDATFAALRNPLDATEASRLSTALRNGRDDEDANAAIDQRNRAFWALEDVMRELRAALRFVLRDEPKKLAPLLSRYEADRRSKRRRAGSKSNGVVTTPVAPQN